jgi:hypothetical protein
MTLMQELGLVETVAGDIAAFAAGQPVSASKAISGTNYSASVVLLGASATPDYQVFSGSFLSIIGLVLADAAAFAAGAPLKIAEKIGNTWYGLSLTAAKAA